MEARKSIHPHNIHPLPSSLCSDFAVWIICRIMSKLSCSDMFFSSMLIFVCQQMCRDNITGKYSRSCEKQLKIEGHKHRSNCQDPVEYTPNYKRFKLKNPS